MNENLGRSGKNRLFVGLAAAAAGLLYLGSGAGGAGANLPQNLSGLNGPFDLAGPRTAEVQHFIQESQVIHLGFDGKRTGLVTYTVKLRCVPAPLSGKDGDEYTCREFKIRVNEGEAVTVPALAGWSYLYKATPTGMDEKGQVFGIPHDKFEDLVDSRGNKLPVTLRYPVYNSFIDFHAFCDILARPIVGGAGIQDLKTIGQKIVHASAFTEPPVNLGSGIKAGSFFRNGEVKLAFKGLGLVDGAACAVIGHDSGESTLRMIMPLGADRDMVTEGGSEYLGDIYIDLETRWVRKITLDEFVVTETRMPGPGGAAGQGAKIPNYTVRHLLTRLVGREEFEKD
ncbi:MAG: hypothetical protein MUQ00_00390 [Candidatus Aminicenantes bacterium]|nr:hypothetical protein [Candidatus Aminicenantes bacterium]